MYRYKYMRIIYKPNLTSAHERHAFASKKILHPQFKWNRSSKTPQLPQKYQSIVFLTTDFCFI